METIEIADFANRFPDLAANANGIAYSNTGARAYFVELGPEMAKRLLEYNTDNYRKIRPKHVDLLTKEMRANNFLMNGDPLRIGENEIIIDGQHRLEALSVQDTTHIEFLIVDRLPETVVPTINANALSRSYIDHLRRRGFQNATNRSALTILLHKWMNDRPLDSHYSTTIKELDKVHDPHEKHISWAISNSLSLSRKLKGIQPALVSLSFLILGQISETAVKQLFIGAAEGENIHGGMPAYTLAQRLRSDFDDNVKRSKADQMWFVFRCFDVELKNTMRDPNDLLTIYRLLPLPREGVSTRDLKKMLETQ